MAALAPSTREIIEKFIHLVSKEKKIHGVYLYGSYAKGKAGKWSDIDLAVVSPDFSEDLFEERLKLMKLAMEVDDRIEPSPFRPEDFNKNHPLANEINKTGVEIEIR